MNKIIFVSHADMATDVARAKIHCHVALYACARVCAHVCVYANVCAYVCVCK